MKTTLLLALLLFSLTGCSNLATIPYSPPHTPEQWLESQPYRSVQVGGVNLILMQPSSTVFVFALGLVAMGAGFYFLRIREELPSRLWWGIALILWGLGALVAGISYQAFSYELKCAGKALCSWTTWWEIVYLLLSAASVDAMLISGAYSSDNRRPRLKIWAVANIVTYTVLVTIGVITLNKFLISFELLLITTTPNIIYLFSQNGSRYMKHRSKMDLALSITWLWLGVVIALYIAYLQLGFTETLWHQGIWFSENDVLHLGLISWMLYIGFVVSKHVE